LLRRKTQIALKFAQTTKYRHSVFWVRANNFTNFANDYARILKILDPTTVEVPSQSNRIIEVFEKTVEKMEEAFSSWLLILDNADDLDQFIDQSEEQNRIIRYLPKKGRILLTTRDRRFQGIFAAASSGVQVKPMSNDEAMTLLHRSVASRLVKEEKYSSNSGASELLEELGNLPLAIGQAAANIRELQLTVEQYVVSYRDKSQRMGLMQEPVRDLRTTDPRTSSQSVAVTLELSFEYLEKRHPLSAALLCYLGFCNWQNVPEFLILAMPEFRNLQHLAFRDVVKRLLHLSLAEEGMEASVFPIYHIHPVVHERISTRLSPDEQRRYFSPMVAYMAYTFPFVGSENDTEFKICRYLIPHAIHQVWAGSTLSVIDRSYARLLQVVSNFLSLSGLTRDAVALSRRAMDIAAKVWDKDDPSILYVRKTMIECLKNHDLYGDAEIEIGKALLQLESDALQAALSTEKLVSERSGVLIDLVACLGVIRDQLAGDLQERSKHWALFRNSLALCLLKQDRVKDAQQVNDEMVTFAETMEGKGIISRTDYLAMLELRGFILRRLRILDQAPANVVTPDYQDILVHIAVFQESLETFGIGNTSTWRFANHSIGALLDSKRLDKATGILETLLKAAIVAKLRIEGTLLSKFHITFSLAIRLIRDLATASDREQRLGSARFEGLLLDAITTAGLGLEEILESYDVLNTYGALCQCRGDFCFAETLHRQALEKALQENKLIDVGIIYYNIMLAIARQPGRVAEAYAFREQHLAALNRVEAVNGDLNKQLSRFEHDRSIYEQAQNKLRLGQLAVGDTWWKEHDDALKRAEVMYGFLVPPQPEPSIHVPPVQVELMASKRLKISISSITTALRFRRP
jgi:tetratricopeptide (TPR) repeat protein